MDTEVTGSAVVEEGPVRSVTPSIRNSQRRGSRPHDPVYRTGAVLGRATSAFQTWQLIASFSEQAVHCTRCKRWVCRVTERNRTAVEQIHSLSPETSTGPGHSGRSRSRTHKVLSYSTGFQRVPVAKRVALPFVRQWRLFTHSSPTRIRTRNTSLEARDDVHFTIEP